MAEQLLQQLPELLEAEPWDLVVLDEAHHARRSSPQNREDPPPFRFKLMAADVIAEKALQ